MEDRYSVLITFSDQSEADGFYNNLNGKKFAPSEVIIWKRAYRLFCICVHLIA